MSRKPKNNHYHYAEKFDYRARHMRRHGLVLPKRFLLLAVALVLLFTVITVTFSYSDQSESASGGSLIIKVRNSKITNDYVSSGMDREEAIALTGAYADLAETGDDTYYISGDTNFIGSSWPTPSAMTKSSGGYYYYYLYTGNGNDAEFKIYNSTSWGSPGTLNYHKTANSHWNVNDIGHGTDSDYWMWDVSGGNLGFKANSGKKAYILAYLPNTPLNSSNDVIVCAAKSLPSDTLMVKLGHYFDSANTWGEVTMTNNSGTWSCSKNITGGLTREFCIEEVYGVHTTKYYKDQNAETMTYNHCTSWQFETNDKGNPKINTVTTGGYSFSYIYSSKIVSVVYPKYQVTLSKSPAAGSSGSLTPSSTTAVTVGGGITITAPVAASAYEWVNWTVTGGTVKIDNYASGTAITSSTTQSDLTVYPYGTATTVTLQANYKLKEYTITYNSDASPATAAAGTITNPATNSVPSSETKQHGVSYTITNNKFSRAHYTQVGWATSANASSATYAFGVTYTTNANLTLYPVWELNVPTLNNGSNAAPSIQGGTMTVGSTLVDLGLTVSDASADLSSRTYTYNITGPSGHHATVGTDSSDASTFMKFTGDIPGTYTVSVTVTDVSRTDVTNLNNTASATTNQVTVIVQPDAPQFSITAYNVLTEDGARDGTTSQKAYMILLGERYYFSAAVDSTYLASHPTSNYTYTWSTNDSFDSQYIVATGATEITFIDDGTDDYQLITYDPNHTYNPDTDPDPRSVQEVSDGGSTHNITLYLRAERNSAYNDSVKAVYYFIQPLIKSFVYEPFQKIFNMNDQTVSLAAEYNIGNDTRFSTDLLFSHNNHNYASAFDEPAQGFIASFVSAIRSYLYPNGPKYFYISMTGPNAEGDTITSRSDTIHTTVGTSDSVASRVLYFDNSVTTVNGNTGTEALKNYLVMCYYIDGSGNLRYQAAQDLNKGDENNEGLHYRVMIPGDASAACFGFVDADGSGVRYYGTPTLTSGVIGGFSGPIFYGYTDQVTLSASTRRITATASSTVGTLKSFTCTSGAY